METTTIKVYLNTKQQLDCFREYLNESYDEIIKKIIFIAKSFRTEPKLSKETIEAIEKARERMDRGEYYTLAQAKKRLGLDVRSRD